MLLPTFLLACSENDETPENRPTAKDRVDIALNKSGAAVNEAAVGFSLKFMNQTLSSGNENAFLSPLSLQMAMSMLTNGAAGQTQAELQNTLGFEGLDVADMNSYNKVMAAALKDVDNTTTIGIANSIWCNKSITFKSEFVNACAEYFDATAQTVDFSSAEAAKTINAWCADKTNNLITKVLDEAPSDLAAALINALYFKGIWADEFDSDLTNKADFTNADGKVASVDMMVQTNNYRHYEGEKYAAVELPYGNGAFSMVVVLPNEGVDINGCVADVAENWGEIVNSFSYRDVNLWLPKFEVKYEKKLNDDLKALGIVAAFGDQNADFSAMSESPLFVSFVNQHTYIKVDEKGTEAAAVTVVGMLATSAGPEPDPIAFHVTRPFIYIIKEKSTGALLFCGKMMTM